MHLGEERVAVPAGRREQRLDLGRDEHVAAEHGVEQRLDAEPVAHRDQAAPPLVGNDHGELAAQPVHEVAAELLVEP